MAARLDLAQRGNRLAPRRSQQCDRYARAERGGSASTVNPRAPQARGRARCQPQADPTGRQKPDQLQARRQRQWMRQMAQESQWRKRADQRSGEWGTVIAGGERLHHDVADAQQPDRKADIAFYTTHHRLPRPRVIARGSLRIFLTRVLHEFSTRWDYPGTSASIVSGGLTRSRK
jgi:hypothetical protein